MEFLNNCHGPEGHSIAKSPLFDGSNYNYQKFRMMIYIKSTNTIVWNIIKEGYTSPKKLKGTTMVPKLENEWDKDD